MKLRAGQHLFCRECGKKFDPPENEEELEEEEEEEEEHEAESRERSTRASLGRKRRGKKSSGVKIAAIAVGGLLFLGLVGLGIVLLVRGTGSDGPPADQSKITAENFERIKAGMDRAEVEGILGGSSSSSENDMRDAFRKGLGEIQAAAETGFSRFTEGAEWRRWDGRSLQIWVVFTTTEEGKRAVFSTALQKNGNTYKALRGTFVWGQESGRDLDKLNADRKKEGAVRNDKKWIRGAKARELLIGDWRKDNLDGYVFHNSGKLNIYSLFAGILDGNETTFRILDDDHVEIVPVPTHPNSRTIPQKYEFHVNQDELVLLHVSQNALSGINGPYYRVLAGTGRPGYTQVLAPLIAGLKDSDRDKQAQAFSSVRRLGKSGKVILPTLIELLRSPKDYTSGDSAAVIGMLGEEGAPAIPVLMEQLREPNTRRSHGAVYALGKMGPAAKEALPKLKECLAKSTVFNENRWREALTDAIRRIERMR